MSPSSSIGVNLRVTGHCSQGGRKYMEDFFSVAYQQSEDEKDLEYAFFGIYDGHGGKEAATYAKEHLMNSIVNQKLFWSDYDQDVLKAIREGYIATHYAMWDEQEKWPKTATGLPSTAGTTASVAFIRRGKIYIGHVGDSGIILGFQNENEKCWKAIPLTHDHKPECNVEKTRIINSGGKVVTKSGVPRVVWNRPRIGHQGPVRRSTPIDEIPFLAVARSLGDLWSYNSASNEFVVSPDPDVRVVKVDLKSFKCLIFGTDGLWNVLTPSDAVDLVRDIEVENEKLVLNGTSKNEWKNPSKSLVDKALERWNSKKIRADNTSVVTIMLDPPGPPKREMFKSCSSLNANTMYNLGYMDLEKDETLASRQEVICNSTNDNLSECYPMLDNSTVALLDSPLRQSTLAETTNGYAIMTSFEDNPTEVICNGTTTGTELSPEYHNYNHLHDNGIINEPNHSHFNLHNVHLEQQYQYQQQCISTEEGYSLTKLETRCEQQFRREQNQQNTIAVISAPRPSVSSELPLECYDNNQYDVSSSYQQATSDLLNHNNSTISIVSPGDDEDDDDDEEEEEEEEEVEKEKNYIFTDVDNYLIVNDNEIEKYNNKDHKSNKTSVIELEANEESIQINEITSSMIVETGAYCDDIDDNEIKNNDCEEKSCINNDNNEPKVIRRQNPMRGKKRKLCYKDKDKDKIDKKRKSIIIKNSNDQKSILIEQNENISLQLEPRKLRSTVVINNNDNNNCTNDNSNRMNLRSREKELVVKIIKPKNLSKTKNLNNCLRLSNSTAVVASTPVITLRKHQVQHWQEEQEKIKLEKKQKQQHQIFWSLRQTRSKNSPILHQNIADISLKNNYNNTNSSTTKKNSSLNRLQTSASRKFCTSPSSSTVSSSSLISSSYVILSTPSSSRRTTSNPLISKNSACYSNSKLAVQTRNQVQKN